MARAIRNISLSNIIVAVVVAIVILFFLKIVMRPGLRIPYNCKTHLSGLGKAALIYAYENNGFLPDDLAGFFIAEVSPKSLVCPDTGHEPGLRTEVNQWSDFTYIPGLDSEGPPEQIVAFCPPRNHNNKYGFVLFLDSHVERLKAKDFFELLEKQGIDYGSNEP